MTEKYEGFDNFEDWLDAIRIEKYEKTKHLSAEELRSQDYEVAKKIADEYGIRIPTKPKSVANELSPDEKLRPLYEEDEKAHRDELTRLNGTLEQGIAQEKIRMAKKALQMGFPINDIVELTSLSLEKIELLRREV
jgi:predicted transposase/invertase (TIGR01784 family)